MSFQNCEEEKIRLQYYTYLLKKIHTYVDQHSWLTFVLFKKSLYFLVIQGVCIF